MYEGKRCIDKRQKNPVKPDAVWMKRIEVPQYSILFAECAGDLDTSFDFGFLTFIDTALRLRDVSFYKRFTTNEYLNNY